MQCVPLAVTAFFIGALIAFLLGFRSLLRIRRIARDLMGAHRRQVAACLGDNIDRAYHLGCAKGVAEVAGTAEDARDANTWWIEFRSKHPNADKSWE